jgi:hypothetical protein
MATNARDITNETFGWLTALRPAGRSTRYGVLWVVRCRCGRGVERATADLTKKPRRPNQVLRSCGCNKEKNRVYKSKYGNVGELRGHFFGKMKTSAKHRGHKFDVTPKYLWDLFLDQDRRCALTGVPLALDAKYARTGETIASLDRVRSDLGYVPNNVQWVHPTVNFMKHAMPQEQFVEWCRLVAGHAQRNGH